MSEDASSDDDFLPIRALNDLLFCERRCALHQNERIWIENHFTLEGTAGHEKVHAEPTREELGGHGRRVRGMWLRCERLQLVGRADLVEFRDHPYPVEYKRGPRRAWDNDDVQLCAQALCLEEMLRDEVPCGAVFHIESRHRREVRFDPPLRALTQDAAARLRALIAAGVTPPPVLLPRCRGCSVRELCLPEIVSQRERYDDYVRRLYEPCPDNDPE